MNSQCHQYFCLVTATLFLGEVGYPFFCICWQVQCGLEHHPDSLRYHTVCFCYGIIEAWWSDQYYWCSNNWADLYCMSHNLFESMVLKLSLYMGLAFCLLWIGHPHHADSRKGKSSVWYGHAYGNANHLLSTMLFSKRVVLSSIWPWHYLLRALQRL